MYVSRHKRLIRTCNYGILSDEMICDQVLEKCYSARLRHRLHLEETLTLDVVFNTRAIARAIEASDCQAQKNHPTSIRHKSRISSRPSCKPNNYPKLKTYCQTIHFHFSKLVIIVVVTVIEQKMLRAQLITKHAINMENVASGATRKNSSNQTTREQQLS